MSNSAYGIEAASNDKYVITPTSNKSADCDPVILRQTQTTRLVFIPQITNNVNDVNAAVKGVFAYQRKGKNDEWEHVESINLASLKKGEGVKLELNTAEILTLFEDLSGLYQLHSSSGIPPKPTMYLRTDALDTGSLEISSETVKDIFNTIHETGVDVLSQVINWVTQLDNAKDTINQLQLLAVDDLQKLNALAAASSLQRVLDIWQENKENNSEEFWQRTFSEYSFTLSQLFSLPVVIFAEKAYIGGKAISNSGGNLVDYIIQNNLSLNTALIEIKTPLTPLLGSEYRAGAFSASKDLSGSITQTLTYKDTFIKESSRLRESSEEKEFIVHNPKCLLIIGNYSDLDTVAKKRSFELLRSNSTNVDIVTFDELFNKIEILADLIEGNSSS